MAFVPADRGRALTVLTFKEAVRRKALLVFVVFAILFMFAGWFMADANSAYTLADAPRLAELDALDLMMIEQPLSYDDFLDHARLQERLRTPVCLDESIKSEGDLALVGVGIVLSVMGRRARC